MTQVDYVFGDLLTGEVIQEIGLQGVSIMQTFSGGELRGTLHLDQSGKQNSDLVAATIPGRCFVVAEREGVPIWDGIIWTRTYQSQSKSAQLYCRDYKAYTERRFIRTDFLVTDDQIDVFLQLYALMQSDPNSIIVNLPTAFASGVEITVELLGSENKTFKQVIDSFANAPQGFDWIIKTSRDGGTFSRNLLIGYPTLGTPLSDNSVTFDYPGSITNYWKNETMGEAGTHFFAVGNGTGETQVSSEAIETTLLSNGYPRYDIDVPSKDVTNQALLDNLVMQALERQRAPMPIFTVEAKGDLQPVFGDYEIGDIIRLHIEDPMHPTRFLETKRLLGWDYYPSSDESVEKVRLLVEGDEEL